MQAANIMFTTFRRVRRKRETFAGIECSFLPFLALFSLSDFGRIPRLHYDNSNSITNCSRVVILSHSEDSHSHNTI